VPWAHGWFGRPIVRSEHTLRDVYRRVLCMVLGRGVWLVRYGARVTLALVLPYSTCLLHQFLFLSVYLAESVLRLAFTLI